MNMLVFVFVIIGIKSLVSFFYNTHRFIKIKSIRYYVINRITIAIDRELEKELRTMQAELIKKTNKSVSFSQVLNNILKEGLREVRPESTLQF